ncbi:MAG TPA: hypothetical protein VFF67_10785 [Thermoplasmata archaeon]|nr:hypothetical protein [Thermoplasmata archaeon]
MSAAAILLVGFAAIGAAGASATGPRSAGLRSGTAVLVSASAVPLAWGPPALHYRTLAVAHPLGSTSAPATVAPFSSSLSAASPAIGGTVTMGAGGGFAPMMHCSHMAQTQDSSTLGTAR